MFKIPVQLKMLIGIQKTAPDPIGSFAHQKMLWIKYI